MSFPHTLLIVSHVVHYRHEGRLFAYGPYAREMDVWADLFPCLLIAAPCRDEAPTEDCLAFSGTNITILPQRETGGTTLSKKLVQIALLPVLILGLARAMRRADALHVRCPGNLGLLGAALGPLFLSYRIAKYAGQWSDYPGEARTVRLQKALLRSRWWRSPVLVYGRWPDQPAHVVPFFTSILTEDQIDRARSASELARPAGPLRVLYVGRLSAAKHVDTLLEAISELTQRSVDVTCTVVGDGPQRPALEELVNRLGLRDRVTMAGGMDHTRVLEYYEQSDVLVLISETEGWPKAIAEGMAFGLVCVGSDRGLIPVMLGEERGLVVPPGDARALTSALTRIADDPENCAAMRVRASRWACRYSLGRLRDAIAHLLAEHWKVALHQGDNSRSA
jgi:glycosyltransferase involved in cell wall biosynthesis